MYNIYYNYYTYLLMFTYLITRRPIYSYLIIVKNCTCAMHNYIDGRGRIDHPVAVR